MGAPGKLIAIEGGEGVGKSTQASLLADALGAVLTREPGGSAIGERIRALLLDPDLGALAPRAELCLMLAARAQHVTERIEPALVDGRHVVVDRFSGSTLAYQGFGRGLPIGEVRQACDLATGGVWPDLSVLLDVPFEVATDRLSARHSSVSDQVPDRMEREARAFHRRVHDGFRSLATEDQEHWVVVDGTGPPDVVACEVLGAVRARLGVEVAR